MHPTTRKRALAMIRNQLVRFRILGPRPSMFPASERREAVKGTLKLSCETFRSEWFGIHNIILGDENKIWI